MKQVIGYKYKSLDADFLNHQKVKPSELVGTTVQLCFGRFASEKKLIEDENPDDILDKMISCNVGTVTEFDEINFIAYVMLEHPIPEDIFLQYYGIDREPIYQN